MAPQQAEQAAGSDEWCYDAEAQAQAQLQRPSRCRLYFDELHDLWPRHTLLRARSGTTAKVVATPLGRLRAAGTLSSPSGPNALRRRAYACACA